MQNPGEGSIQSQTTVDIDMSAEGIKGLANPVKNRKRVVRAEAAKIKCAEFDAEFYCDATDIAT